MHGRARTEGQAGKQASRQAGKEQQAQTAAMVPLYVVVGFLAMSTQTWTAHGNGLWTKCSRDSDCNGGRQCLPDSKGKTWRCRTKIGGDDHDVMYDWDECDQCDPNNPSVAGLLCKPNTAEVCAARPCDPDNTLINNRGWWCTSGTSKVIVFSSSKRAFEEGGATVIEAAYPAGSSPGAAVIPFKFGYPCTACGAKWCEPGDMKTSCGPCTPCPAGSAFGARGWLCHKDTDNVCTNGHGLAILDSDKFFSPDHFDTNSLTLNVTIPAASIGAQLHKVSCKDSPACVWGITAAVILVVVVTAGTVGLVLSAGESGAAAGQAAGETALVDMEAAGVEEELAKATAERIALEEEQLTFRTELEAIEAAGRMDGAWTEQYAAYYERSVRNAMRIMDLERQLEEIGDIRIVASGIGGAARRRLRASAGGSGVPGYNNVMVSLQQML